MVWICPKQFLPGTIKDLHARSAGFFKILKKLNYNAYVIVFMKILESVLLEDLVNYRGLNFNPGNPLVDEPSP